ncbi:TetR/AcrR family transcriptional regulator [Nocardia transvalensis]|uniref:TetR/AcrR family transcriptional regulator n=1 Tax=Nocardia transvalensis TaxID=37333 RepID=UPI0018936BD9|nr:TetR/AcrR family transcriptional regulator [Nocardia transvalensis]MBF6331975.1 TetR/AcrR family transcriptional regulator [Nocardia transvalensis]
MATKWGDRDGRRRDILTAGRRLLAEHGYTALQMRDVAKGAGISLGTVYTYFPTKEALYAALYAQRLAEFAAVIEPVCGSCEDPEDLFVAVATEYLDMYRVYGRELNIWTVLAGDARVDPDVGGVLMAAAARVIGSIQQTLERFRGPGNDIDAGLAMALLWSTVTGLADQFTSVRQTMHDYTWDDLVRFAARTLVIGLAAAREETEGR